MTYPAELDEWVDQLALALGLAPADIDVSAVLDLARDAAHAVARPAAPVSAYLAGLAAGRGADPAEALAIAQQLALSWTQTS
jgi:hypothetical protein